MADADDKEKKNSIVNAIQSGNLEELKKIEFDFNMKLDEYNTTALNLACSWGKTDIVLYLSTRNGIDTKTRNQFGWTPFMMACSNGYPEIMKLLMDDKMFDLNAQSNLKETAFFMACKQRLPEVVSLLLQNEEIEVDGVDSDGYTAANISCVYGHLEIVKLLLGDARINWTTCSKHGNATPFFTACRFGSDRIIEELFRHPNKVDCHSGNERLHPLSVASKHFHLKVVEKILMFDNTEKVMDVIDEALKEADYVQKDSCDDKNIFQKNKATTGKEIAALLTEFKANPVTTRSRLIKKYEPDLIDFVVRLVLQSN
jgi:ankyrin repeat protein